MESGFTLIEAVICVGLLVIVLAGSIAAVAGVAKVSSPDPYRESAEREMRRIIALESAIAKYTDPNALSINVAAWKTTMPLPSGTSIPITIQAAKTSLSSGQPALTVSIQYPHGSGSLTLSKTIALVRKAPNPDPGSRLVQPGLFADPNASPTP